jgi:hypothetical protein
MSEKFPSVSLGSRKNFRSFMAHRTLITSADAAELLLALSPMLLAMFLIGIRLRGVACVA